MFIEVFNISYFLKTLLGTKERMRNHSWLRKNWFWVAGGAFAGIHFCTWIMQKAMKTSVQSERQLKIKADPGE